MAENIDDLTIDYEEDGILIIKELDKIPLSKGSWATIVYRYQEWDRRKEEYSADKYTIRRYRKVNGSYRQQNKFNISSSNQAQKLIDILQGWLKDGDS